MIDGAPDFQTIDLPDHLVDHAEAELRHVLAHFLGDKPEEVLDELRLAVELLAQFGILRGDADRARVQVAHAHHDAARDDERRRGETKFLCAHQRADDDVAAGLHLAVDLDNDAIAQAIEPEDLLRFRQSQLPGHAAVFDGCQRRSTRPAVVSGNQHDVRMRFGHAGRHCPDAGNGDELHRNPRARVRVLQIVNELCQVFDRIDVVVRRR